MKSIAFEGDHPITSPYGWRTDPITGARAFHNGIDVGMPKRTKLFAKEAGEVRISTKDSYGGLYIQIRMDDGRGYYQLHLDESIVKVGQRVVKGQLIGYSGNSGNSTGPHTHYGLQSDATVWNSCIDPTAFFSEEIIDPAKFKKGDVLVFTDIQNIRKGSGTSFAVIRQSTAGEVFTVADNPRQADGYNWYDTGNGWVADVSKFIKYIPPVVVPPTPEPEPIPEPPTPPVTPDEPATPPSTPPVETDTPEEPTKPKAFLEILIQFFTDLLQRIFKSD